MKAPDSLRYLHDLEPSVAEFREAVLNGLSKPQKTLPCKYFYDAEGSRLFERICDQPEYYPTRTECKILEKHAGEIARLIGPQASLVEFGSGAGIKIRLLLAALQQPCAYVPVDISREHMLAATDDLASNFPDLCIAPVCADYTHPFTLPALRGIKPRTQVGFFPGSTIGNFTAAEARAFLGRTHMLLGAGAMMIIGVDLRKEETLLTAAYNDAAGVTAAFNLNLLRRINEELQGDFELAGFAHKAIWNSGLGRIEMHLVSLRAQSVYVDGRRFDFADGETIHTENSYKYTIEQFQQIAEESGYRPLAVWTDSRQLFSVHALRAI
ncbi:MAG TPA: L-histidine N(alpha)-methyltransferase [Burkholderiales bacterium]|nr:L-histidine N(alpha)-methyltransferase [Burkholderiales bacterium]